MAPYHEGDTFPEQREHSPGFLVARIYKRPA